MAQIDPNIALQVRGIQLEDPVAVQVNAMALRNAQTQNAMSRYTLAKAQREDEDANALNRAYEQARRPDGTIDRNRLLSLAPGRSVPGLAKTFGEQDKSAADLDAKLTETRVKRLQVLGGALSAGMKDPSDTNLGSIFATLDAAGIPMQEIGARLLAIPDLEQRRQLIKSFAMGTEQGRQAMEALQPKVSYQDLGGTRVAVNQNALAGPVGQMPDVAPLTVTQTPDSIATDQRTRSEGAANRAVTVRGQDLTDQRAREAAGQPSPTVVTQMAQNNVTLDKIRRAREEVRVRPESFGLKNYLPDAVTQRTDAGGVDGRALVADIAGQKIHDRSGAAVTVGESQRLRPYVPNPTDTPETIEKKLANFEREYELMQQELAQGKSIVEVTKKRAGANQASGKVGEPAKKTGRVETDALPDPAQYSGRTMTDTETGMKYRSDGGRWVKVQ